MGRRATRPIFVPLVLDYARAGGIDSNELLRRFALPPEIESQPDMEVDLEKVVELVDAIAIALRDPFLGVHVAERYRRGAYELLEFACRNSPDVRGAALRLVRYAELINPALAFSFTEDDSAGVLSHRFDGLGRQASEFTMALLYLATRETTGRAWTPNAVWFVHEAPADTGKLTSFFGTDRIGFGKESNGLVIGRDVLDAPFAGADPALLRVLETEMARQSTLPPPSPGPQIVAETERAVRATLELGEPRIEKVAKSLRTSVRTLQRRLDHEGTSFQEVLEQTRERLARHHAQRGELSSAQLAFLLGYSDVTAFLRAFKRWTGTSPQELRGGKRAVLSAKKTSPR